MGTVLVTGAGGYVGGRLVRSLQDEGRTVRAIVREDTPWLDIEQVECDLSRIDRSELASHCAGVEAIVHLAGENEVEAARDPFTALSSTVTASMRLAEAAREAGVTRVVYLSTVHVYGDRMAPGVSLTEDMRPEPRSAYAISRLASEHVIAGLAGDDGELVILRLSNSVGAPLHPSVDRWSLVANDLARQGALNGRLALRTAGIQWRDFVALDDVCAALGAAARTDDTGLAPGTYNLGSGVAHTVLDLAHLVQDAFEERTGRRPPLDAPAPPPESERDAPYHVSVTRLAGGGVTPDATPLPQAVAETVAFCLDHRSSL
ncbi:MAG TPA: NAD(P)-dependent oxidoreductase [Solirubrobacteraceae bacterium]|nr:NAD(P)-dependent oxidoreductase [Solirubrobacteraceae bacterium]